MIYVSIDIETTGLDEHQNQMLEFGAVLEAPGHAGDGETFRRIIANEGPLVGDPFALSLNIDLIREIERKRKDLEAVCTSDSISVASDLSKLDICYPGYLPHAFSAWWAKVCPGEDSEERQITVAGKNVAGFDMKFLEVNSPYWAKKFHRRVIDPAVFFVDWQYDGHLPNLAECCKRAGIELEGYHTAVGDAETVRQLVRIGTNNYQHREFKNE